MRGRAREPRYSREEFIAYYGGDAEWEAATPYEEDEEAEAEVSAAEAERSSAETSASASSSSS